MTFVAVFLFNRAYPPLSPSDLALADDGHYFYHPIDPSLLWEVAAGLEGSFLLFFTAFLLLINKNYTATFFTTMTGPQFVCQSFHLAKSSQAKFRVFKHHRSFFVSIEGELRLFLASSFANWAVGDKPDWVTPKLLAAIPEDLLPKDMPRETREMRMSVLKRKEGSGAAEALRDSVRRHSVQGGREGEGDY